MSSNLPTSKADLLGLKQEIEAKLEKLEEESWAFHDDYPHRRGKVQAPLFGGKPELLSYIDPERGVIDERGAVYGPLTGEEAALALNRIAYGIHSTQRERWWKNANGDLLAHNKGERLMLMVSEIGEAMEGIRSKKQMWDEKLPNRKTEEVELGDCVIRIFDHLAGFGFDPGGAIMEKVEFNNSRIDHTHAYRTATGNKQF